MSIQSEFSRWLQSMREWISHAEESKTIPDTPHPAQPGTVVIPIPQDIIQKEATGIILTPDFVPADNLTKIPSKKEGSVLTVSASQECDYISLEVFTTKQDGSPDKLVLIAQSQPKMNHVLIKLQRIDMSLKGVAFLRVKSSPPGGEAFGLETNFLIN